MKRHLRNVHKIDPVASVYSCSSCASAETFNLRDALFHMSNVHGVDNVVPCMYCKIICTEQDVLARHMQENHGLPDLREVTGYSSCVGDPQETCLNNCYKAWRFECGPDVVDLMGVAISIKPAVTELLSSLQKAEGSHKFQLSACVHAQKLHEDEIEIHAPSFNRLVCLPYLDEDYLEATDEMCNALANFCTNGSGHQVTSVQHIDLKLCRAKDFSGASYIGLPSELQKHRGRSNLLNIKNTGNNCFALCYIAMKYGSDDNRYRNTDERCYISKLHRIRGTYEYPMPLSSLEKFENMNDTNINVFVYKRRQILPFRISRARNTTNLDVLLLSDGRSYHYVLIQNLTKLIKDMNKKERHNKYICRNCMSFCSSLEALQNHKERCYEHECVKIVMPKKTTQSGNFDTHQHGTQYQ